MNKIVWLAATFVCLINTRVSADEYSVSYGLGVGESALHSSDETKAFELSYRKTILHAFYWAFEGGGWLDNSGNPQRSSSYFASTSPGFLVDIGNFEIRNSYGIAYITDTDVYLGGHCPQFHGEFYAGIRDNSGNGIGVKYNHFSSAGIFPANIGRDFVLLELSIRVPSK